MSARRFDPNKLIDYSVDYYAVLGLRRDDIPPYTSAKERIKAAKILEAAYHAMSRVTHPDWGGSADEFKMVVHAHTILSDPLLKRMFDSGGRERIRTLDGDNVQYEIDWDKLGTYRQGTMADSVGYALFFQICQRAEELGIKPAFYPSLPEHNYEWDLAVPDMEGQKLSISLVHDAEDVLRLTAGEIAGNSLPFKIYICFPRAALRFIRKPKQVHVVGEKEIILRGELLGAEYADHELLETTTLEAAEKFIASPELAEAVVKLRNGELENQLLEVESLDEQHKWVNTDEMKRIDTERIRKVLRMRTVHLKADPNAADFLPRIPMVRASIPMENAPLPESLDD